MKTVREEHAAVFEIAARRPVHHPRGAEAFLAEQATPRALDILRVLSSGESKTGPGAVAICLMVRHRKRFPDNCTAPCADCGVKIEYRPELQRVRVKLCSFCGLRRVRGDA